MINLRKKIFSLSFLVCIFLILGSFLFLEFKKSTKSGISNTEKPAVEIRGQLIDVEIADTFEKQKQGLSNRPKLNDKSGMLFAWSEKEVRRFWMKDMNFPLDIIWISDGRIVNISPNLPPEGNDPQNIYSSVLPVEYVLEVNAGFCEKYGIRKGEEVFLNL